MGLLSLLPFLRLFSVAKQNLMEDNFPRNGRDVSCFCTPPLQPITARRSFITATLALCGGRGQYLAVTTVEISILDVFLYDSAFIAVTLTWLVLLQQ